MINKNKRLLSIIIPFAIGFVGSGIYNIADKVFTIMADQQAEQQRWDAVQLARSNTYKKPVIIEDVISSALNPTQSTQALPTVEAIQAKSILSSCISY